MKIVLHIGTEKTATTSIQKNLYGSRQAFAAMRILYPDHLCGENHLCLPACAAGQRDLDEITASAYSFIARNGYDDLDRYILDMMNDQIRKTDPDLIIFSNEHLHSRVKNTECIKRLKNVLEQISKDIKVVVYIRRQDRLAVSFFSTPFKYGLSKVGRAIPTVSGSAPHYYDYGKLVTNWADVFGRENVVVKLFEEEISFAGGILGSFLNAAGVKNPPALTIKSHNESLSLEAVHLLAQFNEQVASSDGMSDEAHRMRASLVQFLEKNYPSRQRPASKEMARRFYDACRPSNDIVLRQFFPYRTVLFDENFDEYGGDERLVPDAQKMAEIGAKLALWKLAMPKDPPHIRTHAAA